MEIYRMTPYEYETTAQSLTSVNILSDTVVKFLPEGPVVVEENRTTSPRSNSAAPIFCAACRIGPQYHTISFQGEFYCKSCGDLVVTMFRHNYRDCQASLPESTQQTGQLTIQNTGLHWLRKHGQYLAVSSVGQLEFPPPKGETYVGYIREAHRVLSSLAGNALIVDDPMDYNMWYDKLPSDPEAVVWYRVKKILLVPFTNFPLF